MYGVFLVCFLLLSPCYFEYHSLCLVFVSLISMYLGMFLLGSVLYGTLSFLDLIDYFLSHVRDIFNYNLFKDFLICLFFSFSSAGTPIIQLLVRLLMSQRSLRLSSVLFILFTLLCSSEVISIILSYRSLVHSSISDILLLIASRLFFISAIVLFVSVYFFFNSSKSLLIDSCIFFILFSRVLIIFTITILCRGPAPAGSRGT